ncbi:unnamed protein product [Fraxinus pennsylvanica]|uniref:DC1 domain-containing protein n=1 Tax=Fraxinus pennsylvanica TaxID=56036 RepID=A0AAD2ECR1_9LAMI|nr:unnamed protein product [Fraxinus pennsylvanica]
MSRDNWERLVVAVLRKEELREIALAPSVDPSDVSSRLSFSSIYSDVNPRLSFSLPHEHVPVWHPQGDNMLITKSLDYVCCEHDYELKMYKKLFNCDGCKMKGFGERYTCNPCGRELHKECRHPQPEVSHENLAGSVFIFRNEPFARPNKKNGKEFSKCCHACGKDICGFNYHCEADNKDLHPPCVNLKMKLEIDGTIFDLKTKVSSKCCKCGKQKISRDEKNVLGWSYVSPCKKYHFHVYCITEMVQEAYMKYGDLALENMVSRELVRNNRYRRGGTTIKLFFKILLSALLGDPTMQISDVLVEPWQRM